MARQRRAIETRARILAAASDCFSESGYRATRIADILERGKCSPGALLFHFPAKADIANEIIEQQHGIVMKAADEIVATESESGLDRVILLSATLAELISGNAVVRAGLRLSTESLEDLGVSTGKPYLEWIELAADLLEKASAAGELAPGVEPRELAEVIIAAFTGTQYLSGAVSGSADLPERLAKLWPVLFSPVTTQDYTGERVRELLERHEVSSASESTAE